jgi:hypothetical protein
VMGSIFTPQEDNTPQEDKPPRVHDGFAIASLVLGLFPVIPVMGSVLAIVFGVVSRRKARSERRKPSGLSAWGIGLGIGAIILAIELLIFLLPGTSSSQPAAVTTTNIAVASWYRGTGGLDFQAVQEDITTLQDDADGLSSPCALPSCAGGTLLLSVDGSKLATDAQAALRNPIPVGGADYRAAMNYYINAGNDLVGMEVPGVNVTLLRAESDTALQLAGPHMQAVTAIVNGS